MMTTEWEWIWIGHGGGGGGIFLLSLVGAESSLQSLSVRGSLATSFLKRRGWRVESFV